MSDQFWLTKAQLKRIESHFPKSRGVPRADDRRVVSGTENHTRRCSGFQLLPRRRCETSWDVSSSAANTTIATTPTIMSPIKNCLKIPEDRSKYSVSPTTVCAANQTPALIPGGLRSPAKKRIEAQSGLTPLKRLMRSRLVGTRPRTRRMEP